MFTGHPVALPLFEGPLDLLLYLINREEIDVFNIPIERITAQYLEYLETLESLRGMLRREVETRLEVLGSRTLVLESRLAAVHRCPDVPKADQRIPSSARSCGPIRPWVFCTCPPT